MTVVKEMGKRSVPGPQDKFAICLEDLQLTSSFESSCTVDSSNTIACRRNCDEHKASKSPIRLGDPNEPRDSV